MIGTAVQKGSWVYVYDDDHLLQYEREGELVGYTATSVFVKNGVFTYVYDQNGNLVSIH